MNLGSRGASIAATSLVALAMGASPALAAKDDKKKSDLGKVRTETVSSSTTAEGDFVTLTAQCPKGTRVVGGGYATGTADDGGSISLNVVLESRRSGGKAWTVSAYRDDAVAPAGPTLPVSAEAYCRSGVGKVSEVSAAQGANPTTTPLVPDAPCSPGKAITAGGFAFAVPQFDSSGYYFNNASRPIGNVGWSVEAGSGTAGVSATALAYCQKRDKPLKQSTGLVALSTNQLVVNSADTLPCPGKRSATAGGFEGPIVFSNAGSPVVVESRRAEKSWHVGAINGNSAPGGFVNAFALCS